MVPRLRRGRWMLAPTLRSGTSSNAIPDNKSFPLSLDSARQAHTFHTSPTHLCWSYLLMPLAPFRDNPRRPVVVRHGKGSVKTFGKQRTHLLKPGICKCRVWRAPNPTKLRSVAFEQALCVWTNHDGMGEQPTGRWGGAPPRSNIDTHRSHNKIHSSSDYFSQRWMGSMWCSFYFDPNAVRAKPRAAVLNALDHYYNSKPPFSS